MNIITKPTEVKYNSVGFVIIKLIKFKNFKLYL